MIQTILLGCGIAASLLYVVTDQDAGELLKLVPKG